LEFLDVSRNGEFTGESLKNNPSKALKSLKIAFCEELFLPFSEIHSLFPELEELDVSNYLTGISLEEIFRRDYRREEIDPEEKDVMFALKVLHMRKISGEDELYEFRMKGPVYTRTPNVEMLNTTDTVHCAETFLINLSQYCPKLKTLNISGSAIASGEVALFESGLFDRIIASLNGLEILAFNYVTDFDHTNGFPRFSGSDLNACVESFSVNLKDLKVLELSEYPDLCNEHVVKLITNLAELKELKIQLCPKVDHTLFSMLTADPEFSKRQQQLKLMVHGTDIRQGIHPVHDVMRLDFEWKKRDYKSLYNDLSLD